MTIPGIMTVVARVRPLLKEETRVGAQVAVTMTGSSRLVVANPHRFEASTDVVVGLAAAVNRLAQERPDCANLRGEDYARGFDFDHCFW